MSTIYTDRRRNVGLPPKPGPISFTDLQHKAHQESKAMKLAFQTKGAFGGKAARNRRVQAPKDLLPAQSPVA